MGFHAKYLYFALTLGLILCLSSGAAIAKANPKYAAIVMDADTGMILHQNHADKILYPASLVKMMTLMLTFDALEKGDLRLSDRVVISRHAASMIPSKLNIPAGSSIRVEDAIYALVTKSANDVAVALAEKIAGSESGFTVLMNRKAKQLGMTRTRFKNASGLHNSKQVSTARDMAKLAQHLVAGYPGYYHYFSTRQFTYRGNTYRNHNRLMDHYRGMDGLKTGYIQASGFNLVASVKRDGHRLIGVVFGGRTAKSRNSHMSGLLDRSFAKQNRIAAASGTLRSAPLPPQKPVQDAKWAALNPILQNKQFSAMIGEGDYDPALSKRLETGLLAIAAVRKNGINPSAAGNAQTKKSGEKSGKSKPWAIQVGAFNSRVKTDKVIEQALHKLPLELSNAAAVIAPLKTRKGWLFRGRLSGYNKTEALRACQYLSDCLPVSPRAY